MQKKIWKIKSSEIEPDKIVELSKKYNISNTLATVLLNRGIDTDEKMYEYIKKPLSLIHNPFELPDMEKAVNRIVEAINNGEKITIYGDYDADGVTSTVLLYSFLRDSGADVEYYIPDRCDEGYGLNIMAVNKISKNGTKLLITVDCGILSFGEVELASAQKMDVIITDHHTPLPKLPNAYAVINPKRSDSDYPFRDLAGVGVGFKLILAITIKQNKDTSQCFNKYVVFAGIGTIADVVSLKGENRVIADRGIKNLENCKIPGINALMEVSGAKNKLITASTISFMLSPRINAAGRMENAKACVDLLLTDSLDDAYKLALNLDNINKIRQKTEQEIFNDALLMIQNDPEFEKKKIIVLSKKGWHHGVIGIVASRICEMFYKPCILIAEDENSKGTGSGRSIEGINLFDALNICQEHLTKFGGHSQAAGLSLDMNDFTNFCEKINAYIKENFPDEPVKTVDIDCSVSPEFLTLQNAKQLEMLEPFGMDNEKPTFAINGVKVISATCVGIDNKHLKLKIEAGGRIFDAIGFSFGEYAKYLSSGLLIDIAFELDINEYNSQKNLQLIIKDIKSSKK